MQPNQIVGMSGRDPVALLRSEAQRRPEIAAMMTQIDLGIIGPSDIETAAVPLLWYRNALLAYCRLADQRRALEAAGQFSDAMGEITVAPPQTGAILRYTGEDRTLVSHMGISRLTTPIRHGDLLFRQTNDVWLGSTPLGNAIPAPFVIVKEVALRSEYIGMSQPIPQASDIEMSRPQTMGTTASGFTFRHT
ncbi:MAG: hypothetical protein EOO77_18085 [Oxalobacteraceae bacterium]|nr:MAG: hypothetical protein EOO77_18085 [Oxalobacteraceae bacterium]